MKLFKNRSARDKYAKDEYSASNFIPYSCHWNRRTILTKNEELLQVIKVGGFSFETADDEDLDIKKNLRNNLLKGLSTGGISLFFHTPPDEHQRVVILKYLIFCRIHQIRYYLLKEQYFYTVDDDNRLDKIKLHYLPLRLGEFANLDE